MNIRKILWASDNSTESEQALGMAKYLAKQFGSKIHGLFVSEIHFPIMFGYPIYKGELMEIVEKTEKDFEDKFSSLTEKLNTEGVNFKGSIVRGGVAEAILHMADQENADLVVMGKRGHQFNEKIILGSQTIKVLRDSNVPVLAYKKKSPKTEERISSILVALDISEKTDSAIKSGLELALKLKATLIVVYVFWVDTHVYDIPSDLVDRIVDHSSEKLIRRVKKIQEDSYLINKKIESLNIQTQVLYGFNPGISVSNYAYDNSIDLIVINTHGRKGSNRVFLGSVTETVIRESNCSVLAFTP
jgi:nucleotide-binding universal stress UspA family protein